MAERMTLEQKRRKRQLEKRRKKKRRVYRIRRLLILFIISGVLFGGYRIFGQDSVQSKKVVQEDTPSKEEPIVQEVQTEIEEEPNLKAKDKEQFIKNLEIAQSDYKNAKVILGHLDEIPDTLLKLSGTNFSSIDFVAKTVDDSVSVHYTYPKNLNGGRIPYYIQWDQRWGYQKYGEGIIGDTGCGPTSAAMVVAGLTKKSITPDQIAKISAEKGFVSNMGTSWQLYPFVAETYGLKIEQQSPEFERIKNNVEAGNAIIVSVLPGDFTDVGHVMVIVGVEGDKIVINDPNNRENSETRWDFDRLAPQIKTMWVFSKNGKIL